MRTIEGEHPRGYFRVRNATLHAGEALAEVDLSAITVEPLDFEQVLAILERHFERIGEPLLDAAANGQPIDHYFDSVALILVEIDFVAELDQLAVDLGPHEAGAAEVAQFFFVFAFAIAHHRGKDMKPGAL